MCPYLFMRNSRILYFHYGVNQYFPQPVRKRTNRLKATILLAMRLITTALRSLRFCLNLRPHAPDSAYFLPVRSSRNSGPEFSSMHYCAVTGIETQPFVPDAIKRMTLCPTRRQDIHSKVCAQGPSCSWFVNFQTFPNYLQIFPHGGKAKWTVTAISFLNLWSQFTNRCYMGVLWRMSSDVTCSFGYRSDRLKISI